MNWSSLTTLAGAGVAVVGLVTVLSTTSTDAAAPATQPTMEVTTAPHVAAIPDAPGTSLPEIPGVPAEVTRVLYWMDAAETVAPVDLSEVPLEVGSVLMEYGVPLRVPKVSNGVGK
jgi:hypothetical protein